VASATGRRRARAADFIMTVIVNQNCFFRLASHAGGEGERGSGLTAPAGQSPGPFRAIMGIPVALPMTRQVEAISCTSAGLLKEYRGFFTPGTSANS
jgi:hypothetical protein